MIVQDRAVNEFCPVGCGESQRRVVGDSVDDGINLGFDVTSGFSQFPSYRLRRFIGRLPLLERIGDCIVYPVRVSGCKPVENLLSGVPVVNAVSGDTGQFGFLRRGNDRSGQKGKKVGKKVPFYLSMLVLWTLIGLWHGGTAHYFIASGIVPFILITLSDLLGFINININLFNRIKTLLLMCVSFIFICTSSVSKGLEAFKIIFTKFAAPVSSKVSLINYLSLSDIILMSLGLIILLFADYLQYNKKSLTQLIDKQHALVQYAFIYCEILLIMFYGMLGNSDFIYFQF